MVPAPDSGASAIPGKLYFSLPVATLNLQAIPATAAGQRRASDSWSNLTLKTRLALWLNLDHGPRRWRKRESLASEEMRE